MSGSDVKFRVFNPDHFGAAPGGSDTLLAVLATPFHPIMSHETDEPVHETSAVYLITELAKHLLLLGHEAASRYGEKLLAMEVTITSDPLTVIEIGHTHDCQTCRDGTARAVAMLNDDTARWIVCGRMTFVATEPSRNN